MGQKRRGGHHVLLTILYLLQGKVYRQSSQTFPHPQKYSNILIFISLMWPIVGLMTGCIEKHNILFFIQNNPMMRNCLKG